MQTQITNYVRAGYPGLFIVSHEEQRIEGVLQAVAKETKFNLFAWSITEGIMSIEDEPQVMADTQEPFTMLKAFDSLPEKSILLARDFHMILEDKNPMIYRKLRDSLGLAKCKNRTIIVVGCRLQLPPELEKEIAVIEFSLPDRDQLRAVLDTIAASAGIKLNGNTDPILDAASGLTTLEAENAFALSVVEAKDILPEIVNREKANTIKKNGLLEIVSLPTALKDIGGLDNLKQDLTEKRNLFTKSAREYGLPAPRGALIVGQPGTGKSLAATATRNIFNIPLLRLEAGKLFGSLVGQSEGNWRTAFATAKAIAPCILWIDEVEGLFCGSKSSGETDSGVTNRVIKAILQDMQLNSDGIYYVMTSNDIDGLPDPLIDRMDVWSVDLPTLTERKAIWKIQIEKRGRKADKFDLDQLAQATDGFSGRQIEQVWLKAMNVAFNDKEREPKNADCIAACARFVPTSVTMKEAIEKRRQRLANRAMPASAQEPKGSTARKVVK